MKENNQENSPNSVVPLERIVIPDFIEELHKAAKCVFIAVDVEVARDLSVKLNKAAELLGEMVVNFENLNGLKAEWEAQGSFLDNPHDDPEDRAVGRAYKECAEILGNRFGV
ncbi:hypothetical protein ACOHYD_13900, partial [Desulfobacterota bacterium M19]